MRHLKSGPKLADLFVFNVHADVETQDLEEFVKGEDIDIESLDCISHPDSYMKSFKLCVNNKFMDKIMDENFWPEGIACRRYFKPRMNTHNGEQVTA